MIVRHTRSFPQLRVCCAEIILRGQACKYLIKFCRGLGLPQHELKLTQSLRVVDLRDVSKVIARGCDGSDASEAEFDTPHRYMAADFPQKRLSQTWSEKLVSTQRRITL